MFLEKPPESDKGSSNTERRWREGCKYKENIPVLGDGAWLSLEMWIPKQSSHDSKNTSTPVYASLGNNCFRTITEVNNALQLWNNALQGTTPMEPTALKREVKHWRRSPAGANFVEVSTDTMKHLNNSQEQGKGKKNAGKRRFDDKKYGIKTLPASKKIQQNDSPTPISSTKQRAQNAAQATKKYNSYNISILGADELLRRTNVKIDHLVENKLQDLFNKGEVPGHFTIEFEHLVKSIREFRTELSRLLLSSHTFDSKEIDNTINTVIGTMSSILHQNVSWKVLPPKPLDRQAFTFVESKCSVDIDQVSKYDCSPPFHRSQPINLLVVVIVVM